MKAKHKVFVYGTLLNGYHNHYWLETSKLLDFATTDEKYVMFEQGIPFVSKNMNVVHIKGELYEVDDSVLGWLDHLEGHPHAYKREEVNIVCNFDKKKVKAWLYFYPNPKGRVVESGDYDAYIKNKKNEKANKRSNVLL